jgi:acetoin utilization deacetylase AcuC-like enzyme
MVRIFHDAVCLEHRGPHGYPEVPERLASILDRLADPAWREAAVAPPPDLEAAVLAVHDERYVRRFERAVERGDGLLDSADNPLSAGTWRAAWGAAGATVAALDWVLAGRGRRAFAAVRPPGHHAERDRAMGFCFFGNVAVAAERAIRRHGLERVAVFDFDVHHGNGTQHLFEERGDVLYASVHQYPFYPGSGARGERGRGPGLGATCNVPLPAGSDDAVYRAALEREVLPALAAHRPQLLLLSAGFDAWQADPLGGMRVSAQGFAAWSAALAALAAELCEGRLVSVLEGGYDVAALPDLTAAHLDGLSVVDV